MRLASRRRRALSAVAGVLSVVAAVGLLSACTSDPGDRSPGRLVMLSSTVADGSARVHGTTTSQVRHFDGIRYAKPPVGARRWTDPQALTLSGPVDATKPGAQCAQTAVIPGAQPTTNEDCLFLNITTPRRSVAHAKLPVIVWWHGGGLISGAGSQYDATRLAAEGDAVVITINYRLGLLGYLGLPGLPGSGNFGFADQIASLRWVKSHIAAYGGDSGNLTVSGESGGGFNT